MSNSAKRNQWRKCELSTGKQVRQGLSLPVTCELNFFIIVKVLFYHFHFIITHLLLLLLKGQKLEVKINFHLMFYYKIM